MRSAGELELGLPQNKTKFGQLKPLLWKVRKMGCFLKMTTISLSNFK